jgi:NAD(P)H-dependent FMN reductase
MAAEPTGTSLEVAVILGSTRPGRKAEAVADWVLETANGLPDVLARAVDLLEFRLPLLDEPMPAIAGRYQNAHTKEWAAAIAPSDAFVFVTPEYNRSVPGALKNAIDFLYDEWRDKAAGFVSYGVDAGGARAVEHLRGVMSELHVATVRDHVALSLSDDFDESGPAARSHQQAKLEALLAQLTAWGTALRALRSGALAAPTASARL